MLQFPQETCYNNCAGRQASHRLNDSGDDGDHQPVMSYKLILIPLLAGGLTQLVKFLVRWSRDRRADWSQLWQYGGLPSGHTSFVVALVTVIALSEGVQSAAFAISLAFALLIVRDAVSFRQYLSRYGEVINHLIREHPRGETIPLPMRIEEHLGHTPFQAAVGGLIGFLLGFGFYLWLP